MHSRDIRFSRQNVTINHASARGHVTRNAGDFTRGSQLVTHEFMMTFAGIKVPLFTWLATFIVVLNVTLYFKMAEHEVQLVLMRLTSGALLWVGFDTNRLMDLTLPSGIVQSIAAGDIRFHRDVALACSKAWRCLIGSLFMSMVFTIPLTIWFVNFSRRRGQAILEERHERGAMLVGAERLTAEIRRHNSEKIAGECSKFDPPVSLAQIKAMKPADRKALALHRPYTIAGIPFPWRLEQSHVMMIGTTGTGKTTALRKLVSEVRERGHRAVIFDITGAYMEAFYDKERDTVLNPMDKRCPRWSIHNDCETYAEYMNGAEAVVPSTHGREEFWPVAARTLFVEMLLHLRSKGDLSNWAIARDLMMASLKDVHSKLKDTVAAPLTSTDAARMAESIRSTFNSHAQVLRFLPDEGKHFSINAWIAGDFKPGSILFVTSQYADLSLTRPLLTLWMNIAVNALMRLPRTRELRTWFMFDEVHALHRLPAIESGLQTARGFGGAFALGIHSFEKLAETYGEQGAINIAALSRTKLILATAEQETAQKCSEFIGSREVRQMDEAYSYGYNNSRDASTLTPRKAVEPLVMPDDITNLPSLHGFVKFPDGFPAARIKLRTHDYDESQVAFLRKLDPISINPAQHTASQAAQATGIEPRLRAATEDGEGQEVDQDKSEDREMIRVDEQTGEITYVGERVEQGQQQVSPSTPERAGDEKPAAERAQPQRGEPKPARQPDQQVARTSRLKTTGSIHSATEERHLSRTRPSETTPSTTREANDTQAERTKAVERQESQIERENREGAGIEEEPQRDDHDDGWEPD